MERLSVGSRAQVTADFSPDGKSLVFNSPVGPPFDIGVLSLEGQRQEKMLLESTLFSEANGNVSRDGRWLAYQSNESGRDEIYLAPFPEVTASKRQVSAQGGTRPLWSKDGRELFYYVAPDTIMSVAARSVRCPHSANRPSSSKVRTPSPSTLAVTTTSRPMASAFSF